MTDTKQTETRRQVAERIAAPTIGKVAPAVYHEIVNAIEAALKDRDDEIERLRKHVRDLNHDFDAAMKEANDAEDMMLRKLYGR